MMAKPTLELHYPMIQFLIKYNIPKEGGIETVCRAVENFYGDDTPIPTLSLKYTEPPWAQRWPSLLRTSLWRQPGGVLPYKRVLGMCRWIGSRFQGWIDYNGVTFLVELLEWDRKFSGFLG